MHLVVVGGSDAGISAALRAQELEPDAEITVVVSDDYPNFSICGLPYFLSGTCRPHLVANRRHTQDLWCAPGEMTMRVDRIFAGALATQRSSFDLAVARSALSEREQAREGGARPGTASLVTRQMRTNLADFLRRALIRVETVRR